MTDTIKSKIDNYLAEIGMLQDEYLEMMLAAYLKHTKISPDKVELIMSTETINNQINTTFSFQERK